MVVRCGVFTCCGRRPPARVSSATPLRGKTPLLLGIVGMFCVLCTVFVLAGSEIYLTVPDIYFHVIVLLLGAFSYPVRSGSMVIRGDYFAHFVSGKFFFLIEC